MYFRKIVTTTIQDQSSVILVSSLLTRYVASCLVGLEFWPYPVVDARRQRSRVFPSHRAKQPPSQPAICHSSEKSEDYKIFTRFSKRQCIIKTCWLWTCFVLDFKQRRSRVSSSSLAYINYISSYSLILSHTIPSSIMSPIFIAKKWSNLLKNSTVC